MEATPLPPTELFRCDRLAMRLTVASCAGYFTAARKLAKDSDRAICKCRGCPIGAANAGMALEPVLVSIPGHVCGRCHQPAQKLVFGIICPSCYNRGREIRIGFDRRDQYKPVNERRAPRFGVTLRLHRLYVGVMGTAGARLLSLTNVATENHQTGAACGEALLSAMRRCTGDAMLTGQVNPYAVLR